MNFAREGLLFIVIAALIAAGTFALAVNRRSWPIWLAAFLLTVVALWVAYFFRDPERMGERGERLVIAPADGKIVQITEVDEPSFMRAPALRISIFMNVFNVHVNRYPVSGVVRYVHYNPGRFVNAAAEKASLENEQMSVGIEAGSKPELLVALALQEDPEALILCNGYKDRAFIETALLAQKLGRRVVNGRGAALVIDYGHTETGLGETLQAVGQHAYADPLTLPGNLDLTAHVDFQSLSRAVEAMGTNGFGPIEQSLFLRRLGIEQRAASLKAKTGRSTEIDQALARLIGQNRTAMGELFKVIAFAHPSIGVPPGFEA
jgi:phosphatidylserine decarboxylase